MDQQVGPLDGSRSQAPGVALRPPQQLRAGLPGHREAGLQPWEG